MSRFGGRVAAITGAASGIGQGLAIELAQRGCHLSLCDIDSDGLAATARLAERAGPVRVFTNTVDVADRAAVERWADQVAADQGSVNLIFNNAGVALSATVDDMSYESFHWLMNINFWGVVHGTKAFLPHLEASGDGHIVNISSVFGLVGIPTQSAYNAAKFAVRGFTEALRIELDAADCGVSATTIHPGGVRTNIARRSRWEGPTEPTEAEREEAHRQFDLIARTSPEHAAEQILRAVEKNKRRAMIGPDAHMLDLVARMPPSLYQRLIGRANARIEAG
ncbi:MAG: SDR family NAD(P)-dependent oxidoreductase [Acidimicrobiia bacterium]|nr:SDR family NAD(P)-dependent oxidoreductase [Acidimicrobiia bacterium]